MANGNSAALAVDCRPWPLAVEWRALQSVSVFLITMGIGIITCALQASALGRTSFGLLIAAAIICFGDVLSRRKNPDWQRSFYWIGTSLVACGYAMAYWFAHAAYYVRGMEGFANPQICWLVELLLVAAVTMHANHSVLLRWLALPFSVYVSGTVLLAALSNTGSVPVAGFAVSIPAFACVCGMAWWSLLSTAYRYFEHKYAGAKSFTPDWLLFRCGGELSFGLSVACAIAMPLYMDTLDYAPLWWSIEMPVLLLLCRRSQTAFKPFFVKAIWTVSALMTLYPEAAKWLLSTLTTINPSMNFSLLVSFSVPASGLVMAFAHRLENPAWPLWRRLAGYNFYFFGSAAAAAAVLYMHFGTLGALPYWLVEVGVLLGLGLYLRDRALEAVACVASAAVLSVYGLHWQNWDAGLTTTVVVGCYTMCVVFGIVSKRGGLLQGKFVAWPNTYVVSDKEARLLELIAGVLGYIAVMSGTFLLLGDSFDPSGLLGGTFLARWLTWLQIYIHYNTITWCFCAMALAAYGLYTNKLEHRFCGVLALSAAVAKLCIIDLSTSGASGLARASISTIAVAICCMAMGSLYLGTTKWVEQHKPPSDNK